MVTLITGETLVGRFGTHTFADGPDWQPVKEHVVTYTQGSLAVINGIEFDTKYNYEGVNDNNQHVLNAETVIFEFEFPYEKV